MGLYTFMEQGGKTKNGKGDDLDGLRRTGTGGNSENCIRLVRKNIIIVQQSYSQLLMKRVA